MSIPDILGFTYFIINLLSLLLFANLSLRLKIIFPLLLNCLRLITVVSSTQKFVNYLKANGILHQLSCLYTPSQNGVVEQKYRHIIETAIAFLQTAFRLNVFWGEAVFIGVVLINRMPTQVLQGSTPHFKLF